MPEDYNRYRLTGAEIAKGIVIGGILGSFTVWICYSSLYAWPAGAGILVLTLVLLRKSRIRERKKILNYHFRDFLSSLHTSMLAGYALENAIRQAAADLEKLYGKEDILCRELKEIRKKMELQKTVEQLFWDLGRRSGDEDIRNFAVVILIAKRTGGDMGAVLQSTWRTISEKIDTEKEIDAVIASGRYEQTIMSIMPAAILVYLRLTFTGFLDLLYGNTVGILVMTGCLALYLSAFFWGRKMTEKTEV